MPARSPHTPQPPGRRLIAAASVAAFLGLAGSCAPGGLSASGAVRLWMLPPDPAMTALAVGMDRLALSFVDAKESWSKASAPPCDLVYCEWGPKYFEAAAGGKLRILSPWLEATRSFGSMPAGLRMSLSVQVRGSGAASDAREPRFLPAVVFPLGLFSSDTSLAAVGIARPADLAAFEEGLRALKARGAIPIALGALSGRQTLGWIASLDLAINGFDAYRALVEGVRGLDDPSLMPVYGKLAAWRDSGYFGADPASIGWVEAAKILAEGKAAFYLGDSAALDRTGMAPVTFGPFPRPGPPNGVLIATVWGFCLPVAGVNPEGALALADAYVTAGKGAALASGSGIPAAAAAAKVPGRASPPESVAKAVSSAAAILPSIDAVAGTQESYDMERALRGFFARGSRMKATELAAALAASRPIAGEAR